MLTLYDKMQCHARPEQWAAQQVDLLALDGVTDAGATPWGRSLLARMQESAEHWCGVLEAQLDIMADEDMEWLMDIYGDSFWPRPTVCARSRTPATGAGTRP